MYNLHVNTVVVQIDILVLGGIGHVTLGVEVGLRDHIDALFGNEVPDSCALLVLFLTVGLVVVA